MRRLCKQETSLGTRTLTHTHKLTHTHIPSNTRLQPGQDLKPAPNKCNQWNFMCNSNAFFLSLSLTLSRSLCLRLSLSFTRNLHMLFILRTDFGCLVLACFAFIYIRFLCLYNFIWPPQTVAALLGIYRASPLLVSDINYNCGVLKKLKKDFSERLLALNLSTPTL